jgi:acyl carrier protein
VPSVVVEVERMPLTANGKVDRKRLREAEVKEGRKKKENEAARTEIEKEVARIWKEVLSVEKVGIDDDFFELGGHSLLATQLISSIRQTFHVDLPLRAAFEHPTVASLSQAINELSEKKSTASTPPIVARPRGQYKAKAAPGSALKLPEGFKKKP